MASSPQRGMPSLPSTLIRPAAAPAEAPPEPADPIEGDDAAEGQGRGAAAAETRSRGARRARRPITPKGEGKGHKLSLPDGVFERLQLQAIRRRTTTSAIAAEILDRNLPRLRIEQDA